MRVSAICPPMIEPETKPAAPEPEHEVGTSPPCGSLEAPRKTGEQLCYKDLVIGDEAMGGRPSWPPRVAVAAGESGRVRRHPPPPTTEEEIFWRFSWRRTLRRREGLIFALLSSFST